MNSCLLSGIIIVNLALVSYSLFFFTRKGDVIQARSIVFLSLGLTLDLTSTILMIVGAQKIITFHGIIGYSALAGMLVEALLVLRCHAAKRSLGKGMRIYTRITYFWWLAAYVLGAIMVMASRG